MSDLEKKWFWHIHGIELKEPYGYHTIGTGVIASNILQALEKAQKHLGNVEITGCERGKEER